MSAKAGKKKKKPPPRWRRHLVQAELELPPPPAGSVVRGAATGDPQVFESEFEPQWWQRPRFVAALAALALLLASVAGYSLYTAQRDRERARDAQDEARSLLLRATTAEQPLHLRPNPRSFSQNPDATIEYPSPPEMLDVFLWVGYSDFNVFWVAIDKVDEGRALIVQRITPDSNKELRLSLNSSSFGPGEYRIRLQGYTWSGDRVDAGWVRLLVQ